MKTVKYLGMKAMLVFFTWIQTTALQAGRKYSFDFEYPIDRPPAHDLKINVFYYKNQVVDGDRSGTISITSRNGNTSNDSLWNGGEGVDGEGVEVTCEEIPGFSASNPDPEYISTAVIIPPEFENSDWFELTFIRQGPPQPGSKSSSKGLLVETASLTVRHANFQPAISWTNGEGSFEPDEGVVYFPITITREAEDEDWANIEIFSEQLADTSYFHKRITGNQADIELPLEMDQSIWDQVDNLTIKISMRHAPSFPKELFASINHGQGIDNEIPENSLVCYPNPFRESTSFYLSTTRNEQIKLTIYQLNGKLVTTSLDGAQNTGKQIINWSANQFPAGIYYFVLEIGNDREVGKIMKIK